MGRTNTPSQLWHFWCQYTAELQNRLARPVPWLQGCTPYEIMMGNMPDVSEFLEFEWYQPVWYFEPGVFRQQEHLLAR